MALETKAVISVRNLTKRYLGAKDAPPAVDDVSFDVAMGELCSLLGPSGCGKTTTLRMLAGLERPTAGEIRIGDQLVFSSGRGVFIPANRRKIGMVFQSYAIWPHMTVIDNVAFPLTVAKPKVAKREARERAQAALEAVGLAEYATRSGIALSGGQQQRAVLARALVKEPDVLLLDEPLSNLDVKLRDRMRSWIREVQSHTGVTTVFVTHDQAEALAISDHICVMSAGRIMEVAAPEELYRRPRSQFAAGFVGASNAIPATVAATATDAPDGWVLLDTPHGQLRVTSDIPVRHGQRVEVYVRPEDVSLSDSGAARLNDDTSSGAWRGVIVADEYQGPHWDCLVEVDGRQLKVRLYRHPDHWGGGQEVAVSVDGDRAFIMTTDESPVDDEAGGAPPGVVDVKARTDAQEHAAVLDGSGVA